jgi:MFS family permease
MATANWTRFLGGIGRGLSSRNFRIYWYGNLVFVLGYWVQRFAAGWLAWQLTESAAWLGIIAAAALIPLLVLGPFAGAVADRLGYRNTVIAAMTVGALNPLLLGVLVLFDLATIEILLASITVQGIVMAFDFPARMSLIPNLVDRANLSAAIALNSTTYHAGSFVGPAIGGFVVATLGIPSAFILNGFATLAMMLAIVAIRIDIPKFAGAEKVSIAGDIAAGVKYAMGHRDIRILLLMAGVIGLALRPYVDLLPGFTAEVFGRGAEGLSILMSVSGLGALIGAVALSMRGRTAGMTRIYVFNVVLASSFMMLFAATPYFWIGVVALFFSVMELAVTGIGVQSLIQNTVDPAMRARVISLTVSVGVGGPALGALGLGWLAEHFGFQWPIIGASLVVLAIIAAAGPALLKRAAVIEADPQAAPSEPAEN